jgi:hypothetical protein
MSKTYLLSRSLAEERSLLKSAIREALAAEMILHLRYYIELLFHHAKED